MDQGAPVSPSTGKPIGMEAPKRRDVPADELERMQNQVRIDAAFESDAGRAVKDVIFEAMVERVDHFLRNDPAGQVCLKMLASINQQHNAAQAMVKRLVERYGGIF
jgi:hypothetical protein